MPENGEHTTNELYKRSNMKTINYIKKEDNLSQKNAFTMIELVLAIVVLGILAALALPRIERDLRQEAGDNILSAIRYTQHLALTDNRHKFDNADWQKALWQIRFTGTSIISYTIGSNTDYAPPENGTSIDKDESAIDPINGKYMFNQNPTNPLDDESSNIFITKKYGIDSVVFNDCKGEHNSAAKHIAFDNLGRPHRGVTAYATNDYETYINNGNCQITFSSPAFDSDLSIEINQETGYAFIVGQPDS